MNIYVSHLSWGTKSDSLQNLFSQYGEVSSANVITDRENGPLAWLRLRGDA